MVISLIILYGHGMLSLKKKLKLKTLPGEKMENLSRYKSPPGVE